MITYVEVCHEIKENLTFCSEIERPNGGQGDVQSPVKYKYMIAIDHATTGTIENAQVELPTPPELRERAH